MEFHPKFSGADCACLQTCRRSLDFCVTLCYYDYRNAQVRGRRPLTVCAPGTGSGGGVSEPVQRGKVPPAHLHAPVPPSAFPCGRSVHFRRTAIGIPSRRRAVRIQRKHFPHQPGDRFAERSSERRSERKHQRARMEPAHSHSIGLSKTHRMPLSADSGPRQAPQMQMFPKCRSPCRLQADFPRTARAVRLFCGELLSVRKSIPEADAAVPQTVPLRGKRNPGRFLPFIIPDSGDAVKCGLRKMHKKAALL